MKTERGIKWIVVFFPVMVLLSDGLYKRSIQDGALIILLDVTTFVIFPVICLLYAKRYLLVAPADYGFLLKPKDNYAVVKKNVLLDVAVCSLVLIFVYKVVVVISWNTIGSSGDGGNYGLFALIRNSENKIYWVLYMAITAALVEEIYFRGLLYKLLIDIFSDRKATSILYLLISTALFGAIHWEKGTYMVITTSVFGFAAAIFYLEYKYLTPLIVAHFVIDLYEFY